MINQKNICIRCGKEAKNKDIICTSCGGVYSLLIVQYNHNGRLKNIKELYKWYLPFGIFTYHDFSNSPLKKYNHNIWIKNEGENITRSVKEKELTIGFKTARHLGYKQTICVSSSSGIKAANYLSKKYNIKTKIYSPTTTKKEYKNQFLLGRDYEDTFRIVIKKNYQFNITPGISPYSQEGAKVISWQIIESKIDFDYIIVPCGNGSTLWGICKGYLEAKNNDLVDKIPKIIGVELKNGPIARTLKTGKISKNKKMLNSKARGIDVKESFCLQKAVIAIKLTEGEIVKITEKEIENAYQLLHKKKYKSNYTAATVFAAVIKLQNKKRGNICGILTANEI